MLWFYFLLKKNSSIEEALQEALAHQVRSLSSLEEDGQIFLVGEGSPDLFPTTWLHIESISPLSSTIDWQQQWELFCPYFDKNLCKIPLKDFAAEKEGELLLSPGPGFGDLSHPTTHLMMNLLSSYVENKTVIDLGCGSGILSLAAVKFGAQKVFALDIEPEALLHTENNAKLNHVEDKIYFTPPPLCDILCINMTFEEQKKALNSLACLPPVILSSGILKKQKKAYLLFLQNLQYLVQETFSKGDWLAFVLKKQ